MAASGIAWCTGTMRPRHRAARGVNAERRALEREAAISLAAGAGRKARMREAARPGSQAVVGHPPSCCGLLAPVLCVQTLGGFCLLAQL